jgi:hypothetical protein
MIQVYIVMQTSGNGDYVVGVFRSLDSARNCVDQLKAHPSNKYMHFWIDSDNALQD